jgi:TRAP-type C4-dicarboxylate transport system substrate-binding protein
MKRLLLLVVVFLICCAFLSTKPISAETIKLKFAHIYPPPTGLGKTFTKWAEKIHKDTKGRVEIKVYGAGSLIKHGEFCDATISGVTDMAYGMLNEDTSRFGLDTGLCLAGLKWPELWPKVDIRMRVYNELRQKFPIMGERQKDVEVLFDFVMAPFVFHSPKKAVRRPEDLKGLRVAATGWYVTLAKVLGAVPVALGGPERYMGLERGVIDGSWDLYAGMFAMKILEVTNNYVEADFGDSSGIAIMNKKKFNSLPPDIQKIIRDNRDFGSQLWLKMGEEETQMALSSARKRGHNFVTLTPEERQLWYNALLPLREEWIKQQEAKGFPAKAFMDEMLRLIEQYR